MRSGAYPAVDILDYDPDYECPLCGHLGAEELFLEGTLWRRCEACHEDSGWDSGWDGGSDQ